MNSPVPTTAAPVVPTSNHRESMRDFVLWALAQLDIDVVEAHGELRLQLAESDQAYFAGRSELRLPLRRAEDASAPACVIESNDPETLHPAAKSPASKSPEANTTEASDPKAYDTEAYDTEAYEVEAMELDSRFGEWLLERLRAAGAAVPVRPAEQPIAVNDITQRLFACYRVDDGRVHLGGCQLTDYPFLRLSFVAQGSGREEVRHVFVAHDGSSVPDQLVQDLGLLAVEPILKRPPRIDDTALQALITAGRRVATQSTTSRDPNATTVEPAVIALVWVRHASGQLHFTIGETTVTLPFLGWAKLLEAQPYTSGLSGASSFHLAATDDGRIDAYDQIAACQLSGQRVLRQELFKCSVTGKLVLEKFTEICPVSGKPCLVEAFRTCPNCQQRVSELVLEPGACQACRHLAKIKKDDPRLVWILGEHTGLDRWKHWQLSETRNVYIALASAWTKRLLVVIDKETLAVQHLAIGSQFHADWSPVAEPTHAEILQ